MKRFLFILIILSKNLQAQEINLGTFSDAADIGFPSPKGGSTYEQNQQTYLITSGGSIQKSYSEDFHYLHKKIKGDFILTADFETKQGFKHVEREFGWMIRSSTVSNSEQFSACSNQHGVMFLKWRKNRKDSIMNPKNIVMFPKKKMQTIQLERSGNVYSMRVANYGEPLQVVGQEYLPELGDDVMAGIFVQSLQPGAEVTVRVWNVRIDKPVPYTYHPNPIIQKTLNTKEPIFSCRLESIEIATGIRKIIHEAAHRFEAPNWMPDGEKLLFNSGGLLYKIPVSGGSLEQLNTGSVVKNNNDHGISFDGKMLAISSQKPEDKIYSSAVYVLPLEGGTPKLVTKETPSYWHGWAPGNREVVVVAQRNGKKIFNIYKVDIETGKEEDLTGITEGHVDGCEYSPDGKYIYYNGNQSGTMQIWRMKPDGTEKEQLTYDEYNNWFPHISPDGKWIALISFPVDIDPNAHPSYKKVMIRIMPAVGGSLRVIAHLYGGQGTLNVNSWSPDSRFLAFVSNAEKVN
jgi:Tol biopolymer transport system component